VCCLSDVFGNNNHPVCAINVFGFVVLSYQYFSLVNSFSDGLEDDFRVRTSNKYNYLCRVEIIVFLLYPILNKESTSLARIVFIDSGNSHNMAARCSISLLKKDIVSSLLAIQIRQTVT